MNPKVACCVLFLCLPSVAPADVIPEGAGIIYGKDHVFSLKAPKKWSLDNSSAVKSGLHAVFFPTGSSWAKSTVVAYARSRPVTNEVKSIKDAVDAVIVDFHKNGSPKFEAKKDKNLKADSGRTGTVYKFTGDKYGNFEAVCYFKEEKTINFVVLSSRDKKAFDDAWESFVELCNSYTYISDGYTKGTPESAEEDGEDKAATPSPGKVKSPKATPGSDREEKPKDGSR